MLIDDRRRDDVVVGRFSTIEAAERARGRILDAGSIAHARVVRLTQLPERASGLCRGALAGATLGPAVAAALEATALAFPPLGLFVAGGSLAAAVTGLAVGVGAGASAGLAMHAVPAWFGRAEAGRLRSHGALVVAASSDRSKRGRARTILRAEGAIETADPSDDLDTLSFAPAFARVVPSLQRALVAREGSQRRWSELQRAHLYGWQIAHRPDFAGRSWSDAVDEIARESRHRHPEWDWGDVSASVRAGWDADRT